MGVINFSFDSSLPGSLLPNTLYFIKGASDQFSLVQTDPSGTPYNLNAIAKGPIPFLDFSQSTTPSNPASGIDRFYFKADGNAYRLDSSGSEILLNSNNATYTASVILSPFQVVQTITETTVGIADCSSLSTAIGVVGVTLGSSIIGGIIEVAVDGSSVTDLSWAWTAGLPVYLSTAGGLTQTLQPIPVIVGYAISATTITVNINGPFIPLLEAASDPTGTKLYINSSDGTLRYYNGSWTSLGPVDGTTVSMIAGVLGLAPIASGAILANTTGSIAKPAALPVGTNGQVLTVVGGVPTWAAGGGGGGGGGGSPGQYIQIADVEVQNTPGGTATADIWNVRTLNIIVNDDTGLVTLTGNQFVVPAGSYRVWATAPAVVADNHKIRLHNVTDGTYLYGTSEWNTAPTPGAQTISRLAGVFSIATAKTFQLEHFVSATDTTDPTLTFGVPTNAAGASEVFGIVELLKVAPVVPAVSKTVVVPVTGFSSTIPSSASAPLIVYAMNPAGTLATGTLVMPASPIDAQIVTISSTQTIAALTLNANAGQSITTAVSTLAAGPSGAVSYIYDLASTTWYPS